MRERGGAPSPNRRASRRGGQAPTPTLWGRGRLGPSSAAWLARIEGSNARPAMLPLM